MIITDTFGRPWREGLVDVAIGVAGLDPLDDHRGRADRHGRKLASTIIAVADQLAAAAGLLMLKAAGCPVVLIRGFEWQAARRFRPLADAQARTGSVSLTAKETQAAPAPVPPFTQRQPFGSGGEHLDTNVVRARRMMLGDTRPNRIQITPRNDSVDELLASAIFKIGFVKPRRRKLFA